MGRLTFYLSKPAIIDNSLRQEGQNKPKHTAMSSERYSGTRSVRRTLLRTLIEIIHHFLATHNLGEANLHLHADNCSGQNKNRYIMQYLAWRVLSGLIKCITLSFLVIGHTKFSPDWCFGLFKQAYRRMKIGCLDDIVQVVEKSAAHTPFGNLK